jgi:uncharacterized spore protein YtfJ
MAAPNHKITNVVHTLLDGLHSMSKSETLIGEPYVLGDATIVPVHRMRIALGAGALHGGAKQQVTSGESLGAGGAVQIEPVAVIAVGRDGIPQIMCVENEPDAAHKIMTQLPEMMTKATKAISERIAPLLGKLVSRGTAATIAATSKDGE